MIDDLRFERGLREFAVQWLGLEQLADAAVRPDIAKLDAETRAALAREPVTYLAAHIRKNSTMAELLRAHETKNEPALKAILWQRCAVDQRRRHAARSRAPRRLLSLPGVLAALSHAQQTLADPARPRGARRASCARLPRPPPAT